MGLTILDPVPPSTPREERSPDAYEPMQRVTREIAFGSAGWDGERRQKITELFDGMAAEWHTRDTEDRLLTTRDALERGLEVGRGGGTGGTARTGGTALEIGSGTGIQTPLLLEQFDYVVSIDLSNEMLALSPRRDAVALMRADAAELPLAGGSVDAVVCVNAFLFPAEFARVLRPGGHIVFVASSGPETPIYLPPADVVAAVEPALGPVDATTSGHGWGSWTVVTTRP